MNIHELQQTILDLKREKDVCILAHSYQPKEIKEVADYTGDSFGLSVMAQSAHQQNIMMCGVRFMAETVKTLSPQKKVFLATPDATCPMAEQVDKERILIERRKHSDYTVVAYINTTASLKTVCDVCVTSSSAVKIVKALPTDKILFIPDCNLGDYVKRQVPEKEFLFVKGGCPVHAAMSREDVLRAREAHPEALFLVHPECRPEVVELADYVGSTTGIMKFATESSHKEFIIGTENSIAEQLAYDLPDKRFYPLSKKLLCQNMQLATLVDVLHTLQGTGGEEIILDDETITLSRKCIDRMIELG